MGREEGRQDQEHRAHPKLVQSVCTTNTCHACALTQEREAGTAVGIRTSCGSIMVVTFVTWIKLSFPSPLP